jgi:ketosteroid isomerase-like protein
VPASQATIDLLTEYYGAMESNDPRRYGTYYADDMTLTFANSPMIKGRDNVVAAFAEVLNRVRSLHHDLVNVWE